MIFITQLVYVQPGQEHIFEQFENVASPLITKYNGRLLLRIRPDDAALIEGTIEKPYEIHLVDFQSEADFEAFKLDKTR
jgi:hypothetical protein